MEFNPLAIDHSLRILSDDSARHRMDQAEPKAMTHSLRWFQFSLGTWLIVVAIIGWGLATRPCRVVSWTTVAQRMADPPPAEYGASMTGGHARLGWAIYFDVPVRSLNPRLLGPALAIAAVIVWKCTVVARSRLKSRESRGPRWPRTASATCAYSDR